MGVLLCAFMATADGNRTGEMHGEGDFQL
jgi:hypothetical protein